MPRNISDLEEGGAGPSLIAVADVIEEQASQDSSEVSGERDEREAADDAFAQAQL